MENCVAYFGPFLRKDEGVEIIHTSVDSAGYRTTEQLVRQFKQAGIDLQVFRTAEFDGDLSLNPLHRTYIDPVDRDNELEAALVRAREAKKEYDEMRRKAIDKRQEEFDNRVMELAERLRRSKNAKEQPENVSSSEGSAPLE